MSDREPLLLSWSGGKDCAMALLALRDDPTVEVTGLLTTVTNGYERVSMHGVRRTLLAAQAAAVGLPVQTVHLQPASSNDAYEAAMGAAMAAARERGVRRVAFGDLFLADVRAYREANLAAAGMRACFPLWGRDTAELMADAFELGIRATVVCVDTEQLDPAFLGRELDEAFLADLPSGVDPCGENGEFHTFVHDGPGFAAPVAVRLGECREDGRFHFQDLLPA
ncbi:MAG: ATP-binding protein [Egibacteraceae bacterium]